LAELENDKLNENIDDNEFAQLKQELDQGLLEDAEEHETSSSTKENQKAESLKSSLTIVSLCIVVIIALSGALYINYGAYDDVASFIDLKESNEQLAQATKQAKDGDMSSLLEQLHQKLEDNPDNIEGWSLLARTAMNTERYPLAVTSFKEIIRILKSEPEVDYQNLASTYGILSQAQYYAANGAFDSGLRATIDTALKLNPNEPNTLSLLAIDAFTTSEFKLAIKYWSKILDAYPDHPAADAMKQGINEAQSRAGLELSKFSDEGSPSIAINISIDESVKSSVNPGDTVFVFIKDASYGDAPSPPLAARRYLVSDLPISISLSDADAMSPMAKLSDAQSVNVVARVSKSGQVTAARGDLEGETKGVEVSNQQDVNIVISNIIE
jgi:cytochrome c-type biogenesis protein CcmH